MTPSLTQTEISGNQWMSYPQERVSSHQCSFVFSKESGISQEDVKKIVIVVAGVAIFLFSEWYTKGF